MILKNNWFRTNIEDLHKDVYAKIKLEYDAGDFIPTNFTDSTKKIALEIQTKYDHIYVAYSGGMDSEYVVRLFHKNNIKFTPVCAWPEATRQIQYAYSVCKELNLNPIIIKLNDDDILEIIEEMNIKVSTLINQPPICAICKLAKKLDSDAIVVTGENFFDDAFAPREMHVYNDLITKYRNMILPFFLYNQHIVYEILVAKQSKAQLYNIPFRKKIRTKDYISENLKKKAKKYYIIDRYESLEDIRISTNKFLPSKLLK